MSSLVVRNDWRLASAVVAVALLGLGLVAADRGHRTVAQGTVVTLPEVVVEAERIEWK